LVILVYEVFLDTEPRHVIRSKRFPYFFRSALIVLALFVLLYMLSPASLFINYFYLVLGAVFCIIPISLTLWKHPRLLAKFTLTTVYFAAFSLLNEITGITLGHWFYPGINQHIGKVSMLGVWFPLEEFVFWILLGGMATLAWYEHFADDNR
jgi:Na+/H+-dicarboxylate symporter